MVQEVGVKHTRPEEFGEKRRKLEGQACARLWVSHEQGRIRPSALGATSAVREMCHVCALQCGRQQPHVAVKSWKCS